MYIYLSHSWSKRSTSEFEVQEAPFGNQNLVWGTTFGSQNWSGGPPLAAKNRYGGTSFIQGGPILAAKTGPPRPILAAIIGPGDQFWPPKSVSRTNCGGGGSILA